MRVAAIASVLAISIPAAAQPPRSRVDLGLVVGLGLSDLDDADPSPGVHLQYTYLATAWIGAFAGARYFSIRADEFSEADVDATNWDLDLGARFQMPLSPVITVFGEAMVIYSTVKFSGPGGTIDGAGVGFAVRAGGMFAVRGNLAVGAALGYSHASADIDEVGDFGAGWLGVEAFVSFGF